MHEAGVHEDPAGALLPGERLVVVLAVEVLGAAGLQVQAQRVEQQGVARQLLAHLHVVPVAHRRHPASLLQKVSDASRQRRP